MTFDRGLPVRREIDRFLRKHEVDVTVVAEFDNIENIKQAVEDGAGIAILPSQTLRQEVQRHSLITIPFCQTANNDSFVRPLSIVHRRKRRLNPAIMEFIELLRAGDKTIQSDQDRAVQVEANHDREIAALAPSQEESTETAL